MGKVWLDFQHLAVEERRIEERTLKGAASEEGEKPGECEKHQDHDTVGAE